MGDLSKVEDAEMTCSPFRCKIHEEIEANWLISDAERSHVAKQCSAKCPTVRVSRLEEEV